MPDNNQQLISQSVTITTDEETKERKKTELNEELIKRIKEKIKKLKQENKIQEDVSEEILRELASEKESTTEYNFGELEPEGNETLQAYFLVRVLPKIMEVKENKEKQEKTNDKKETDKENKEKEPDKKTDSNQEKKSNVQENSQNDNGDNSNSNNSQESESSNEKNVKYFILDNGTKIKPTTDFKFKKQLQLETNTQFSTTKLPESIKDLSKGNLDKIKYFSSASLQPPVIEFDQRKGEILGRPFLRLSTRLHNYFECIIKDIDGKIYEKINSYEQVEVIIGFSKGRRFVKFKGHIAWIGRVMPDGVLIKAMDLAATLNNNISQSQPGQGNIVSQESTKSENEQNKTQEEDKKNKEEDKKEDKKENKKEENKENNQTNKLTSNISKEKKEELDKKYKDKIAKTKETIDALVAASSDNKNLPENIKALNKKLKDFLEKQLKNLQKLQEELSKKIKPQNNKTPVEETGEVKDKSNVSTDNQGNVVTSSGALTESVNQANLLGQVIYTNSIGEIIRAPIASGPDTKIVIDYITRRGVIKRGAKLIKRSEFNNRSGFISVVSRSMNMRDKTSETAAVFSTGGTETVFSAGTKVQIVEGGLKLSDGKFLKFTDPIFEGCVYTWGDATKFGKRGTPDYENLNNIIKIAKIIQEMTDKTVGKGKRWQINSWFRDKYHNTRVGGAKFSRHMVGDAVDFIFPGCFEFFDSIKDTYPGGLAEKPGQFVHIDARPERSRWVYR